MIEPSQRIDSGLQNEFLSACAKSAPQITMVRSGCPSFKTTCINCLTGRVRGSSEARRGRLRASEQRLKPKTRGLRGRAEFFARKSETTRKMSSCVIG